MINHDIWPVAQDLAGDAATVLVELIHKRMRRATADAYDRGWHERGEHRTHGEEGS